MFKFNRLKKIKKLREGEFDYYLNVIKKTMDTTDSFLELGPGDFSISDYFQDVTILDNDKAILKQYEKKNRNVLLGDYHSLIIQPNSFDYVVAIHPDVYNSGKNVEWLDSKKTQFKFKYSALENFVSSLINISRKKVFVASKAIADNFPMKELAIEVATNPYYFILYKKMKDGNSGGR